MTIREQATEAAAAARKLAAVSPVIKNKALEAMADALLAEQEEILAANTRDMEAGKAKGLKESLLDRLLLTPARLADMDVPEDLHGALENILFVYHQEAGA